MPSSTAPTAPTSSLSDIIDAAGNAETSVVSITQPGKCCKQTLPQFLGITGALRVLGGAGRGVVSTIRNRLGSVYPGLEAKPPLLAITDPANVQESAPPAVKTAAEVKAEEEQAPQKIKALRYLATIGCGGCYPDVEDSLIAAMEDCTEEVRYEAVLAVRNSVDKECCYCSAESCCSEKIQNKLHDLAYDKKHGGEPSARVRRVARAALRKCCPPVIEPDEEDEAGGGDDIEGPEGGYDEGIEGNQSAAPTAAGAQSRDAEDAGGPLPSAVGAEG